MENLYTPDCIRTYTGIYFNVFEPKPEMVRIEDIAHSLSMQCRFGGHLPKFYSVAQHSLMCSFGLNKRYWLEGLLHDASEAYLLDMPSPIKKRMNDYKEIEHRLNKVIAERFNLIYPWPDEVIKMDRQLLQYEWDYLMLGKEESTPLELYTPLLAETSFLVRFYEAK